MQTHSKELQQVLDVVVSHQALELKCELVVRLLYALVSPRAELFRPLLRRLAGLVGEANRLVVLPLVMNTVAYSQSHRQD